MYKMFTIILEPPAERFIRKLDKQEQVRLVKKIEELKENPKLGKPLVGQLSGIWSLRIGQYRALYQIKEQQLIIFVLRIGHRKNVYE